MFLTTRNTMSRETLLPLRYALVGKCSKPQRRGLNLVNWGSYGHLTLARSVIDSIGITLTNRNTGRN